MENLTFILPISIESEDRKNNFQYILSYLDYTFESSKKIIIDGSKDSSAIQLINNSDVYTEYTGYNHLQIAQILGNNYFHKTKLINIGVSHVDTEYFCLWDADIILSKTQILESLDILKDSDFVYPYNGIFLDVLNFDYKHPFEKYKYKTKCLHENSTGGSFITKKELFLKIGGMNENMISWGFEDDEILERYKKLGLKIDRSTGECYHLHHIRTQNSDSTNPHCENNRIEFEKIKSMTKHEIIDHFKIQDI